MDTKKLGQFGEKTAEKFLKNKGYKILAQNFKRKWGEIDIIGKKDNKIIFFEVKTIIKKHDFFPEDEINYKKKQQLRKMSRIYLSANKISEETAYQIDILAVEISPDFKKAKIRHYKNAIEDNY